jgi:hypothetical protein
VNLLGGLPKPHNSNTIDQFASLSLKMALPIDFSTVGSIAAIRID